MKETIPHMLKPQCQIPCNMLYLYWDFQSQHIFISILNGLNEDPQFVQHQIFLQVEIMYNF